MVNHTTLTCVHARGIHLVRRRTHQSVAISGPLSYLLVRRVPDVPSGRRGTHVGRRSWWVCWSVSGRTVAAG
ncbi:hypothetical protein DEJ48_13275 [Streptomyces venezuelae]|uniref:Uncharacterized protein n=1 Tax=Streptomyces venezuelae TaxID=54571 RepID=A0A5P2C9S9_STRVZ|nr:hypothetical protein DEJ48_13275 [Streptomyces venezuelae]